MPETLAQPVVQCATANGHEVPQYFSNRAGCRRLTVGVLTRLTGAETRGEDETGIIEREPNIARLSGQVRGFSVLSFRWSIFTGCPVSRYPPHWGVFRRSERLMGDSGPADVSCLLEGNAVGR
jgi:hypothetical protein